MGAGPREKRLCAPGGWPLWTSDVRPGREHDTTCARALGLEYAGHGSRPSIGHPQATAAAVTNPTFLGLVSPH
jgi:hypothetical protein